MYVQIYILIHIITYVFVCKYIYTHTYISHTICVQHAACLGLLYTHRVLHPTYTHKHTTYIYPKCIHLCIRYAVSRLGPFYESCVENDIHRKLIIHTQTHHVHPSDMHTCIHIYLTCSLAAGLPLQIGCGQGGPRSICARG